MDQGVAFNGAMRTRASRHERASAPVKEAAGVQGNGLAASAARAHNIHVAVSREDRDTSFHEAA